MSIFKMSRFHGLVLPILAVLAPPAWTQQRLYVSNGGDLYVLDPATGNVLESLFVPGTQRLWSLAHDGPGLIAIDRTVGGLVDDFFKIHPANGQGTLAGQTGFNWNIHGMDFHPLTGETYAFFLDEVYTADTSTGALSLINWLDGLRPLDCICNFAFQANGKGWAVGFANGVLYSVDLAAMKATEVGVIQEVADGVGEFWDLAVDSAGQLWGTYSGGTNGTEDGLYKIDTTSLTIQLVAEPSVGMGSWVGLAFGPATPETHYCTPKTNSLGCVPDLVTLGLASPSASSGYQVMATGVRNQSFGRLLYSVNGAGSTPFVGGTLCVSSPWKGTPIVKSGGSAKPTLDCSGVWTADLNTELSSKPGPQAGDTLHCQWIGRDPGFAAPDNYALTAGLELTLLP